MTKKNKAKIIIHDVVIFNVPTWRIVLLGFGSWNTTWWNYAHQCHKYSQNVQGVHFNPEWNELLHTNVSCWIDNLPSPFYHALAAEAENLDDNLIWIISCSKPSSFYKKENALDRKRKFIKLETCLQKLATDQLSLICMYLRATTTYLWYRDKIALETKLINFHETNTSLCSSDLIWQNDKVFSKGINSSISNKTDSNKKTVKRMNPENLESRRLRTGSRTGSLRDSKSVKKVKAMKDILYLPHLQVFISSNSRILQQRTCGWCNFCRRNCTMSAVAISQIFQICKVCRYKMQLYHCKLPHR